jgi:hypothetical protein
VVQNFRRNPSRPPPSSTTIVAGESTLSGLPLHWEFLQPDLIGALDGSYVSLFKPLVEYAAQHRQKIPLDIHNLGRYNTVPIGSGDPARYQSLLLLIFWHARDSL